jgi:protein-tyrosine phosphatase
MPPVAVDSYNNDEELDLVHHAVQTLAEGKLVAFPTETVYGLAANALDEAAVQRLIQIKGRSPDETLALAIRGIEQAADYVPELSLVGRRLGQRCWPGPVTLVMESTHADSLVRRLPEGVQRVISPGGLLGLRVADHRYLQAALRLLPGPLVLTSANRSGQADAVTGDEVTDALGDDVDLVLNDGRCKYAQPSSVVRVTGSRVATLREGVVTETQVRRFASLVVVVVCTGNTCRSPMAEGLLQKRLADRLGCEIADLEQRGVIVRSAGVAASAGGPAAPNAVQAMQQRGLDLSQHASQPVTDLLMRFADSVLTLTEGHRQAILAEWPEADSKTSPLRSDGYDVADPIGGSLDTYLQCADEIDAHLGQWVDSLPIDCVPTF